MISCMRDGEKTIVSASGGTTRIAVDCCEVIRAIYFELPAEVRPLFKEYILLAVNHKDSPMWQSPLWHPRLPHPPRCGGSARTPYRRSRQPEGDGVS